MTGDDFSSLKDTLERFKKSGPSSERNELSLALADNGNREGFDAIISVLEREVGCKYIGTLVYSLSIFEFPKPIELLTKLVSDSNFEAAHLAAQMLDEEMANESSRIFVLNRFIELKLEYEEEWRNLLVSDILDAYKK